MGPTSVWGLHLIKWYLCTEPRFRGGGVVITAQDVTSITSWLPDIAREWQVWEIELALNILKNDVMEGDDKKTDGFIAWADEDIDDDDEDDAIQRFVLVEGRMPSSTELTREVRACVYVCVHVQGGG